MNKKKDTQFLVTMGGNIRKARMEQKIKQTTLADLCGIQKANISRLETGLSNATALTLLRISEALQVPVSEFMKE